MHRDGGSLFDFNAYFARVIAGIFLQQLLQGGPARLGEQGAARDGYGAARG